MAATTEITSHPPVLLEELNNFTNSSALMIAHERALESEGHYGEPLFNDPYARMLAGTKGAELSEQFGAGGAAPFGFGEWTDFHRTWTSVRTKFIDDALCTFGNESKGRWQFVNLGAGLDTRALRLQAVSDYCACYELDMEEVNEPKRRVLEALAVEPKCPRKLVTANLKDEGAMEKSLVQEGFRKDTQSVFVAEGLIMYLGASQKQFIGELAGIAAPGSMLVLNFMVGPLSPDNMSEKELLAELEKGGWSEISVNRFGDDVLNYGRYNATFPPNHAFSFLIAKKTT